MTLDGATSLKCVKYFGNSISVPHAPYCNLSYKRKRKYKREKNKEKKNQEK